jgi:hypothetical protein
VRHHDVFRTKLTGEPADKVVMALFDLSQQAGDQTRIVDQACAHDQIRCLWHPHRVAEKSRSRELKCRPGSQDYQVC